MPAGGAGLRHGPNDFSFLLDAVAISDRPVRALWLGAGLSSYAAAAA